MDMGGSTAMYFVPFLIMLFFYVLFVVLAFFVLYLVVRAAINNSKLNHNMESLRSETARMNEQLLSLIASTKFENKKE